MPVAGYTFAGNNICGSCRDTALLLQLAVPCFHHTLTEEGRQLPLRPDVLLKGGLPSVPSFCGSLRSPASAWASRCRPPPVHQLPTSRRWRPLHRSWRRGASWHSGLRWRPRGRRATQPRPSCRATWTANRSRASTLTTCAACLLRWCALRTNVLRARAEESCALLLCESNCPKVCL
jgi:hypothetical protein